MSNARHCRIIRSAIFLALLNFAWFPLLLNAQVDDQARKTAYEIFKQLIEINTTDSAGSVTAAAEAMHKRFLEAGFTKDDLFLGGPTEKKENLVVRYRGTGKHKPILFIGHLDVVEAPAEHWSTNPFELVEKDGFYYGRGTQDMKNNDAILVAMLLQFKREAYKPDRDLILALTADEEGGSANGVEWLLANHRDLVDAEYVLNPDGAGVDFEHGRPVAFNVDATEKLYGDFQLAATNPGGHSSMPVPDNAIYHLAGALVRLQQYQFPTELNTVSRAYFERMSTIETGQKAADMRAMLQPIPDPGAVDRLSAAPELNGMIRTTCIATMINGGHATNALPQLAQANMSCRILPGHSLEEVRQDLTHIINDPAVRVRYRDDNGNVIDSAPNRMQLPPPPLNSDLMSAIGKVIGKMWPGTPVVPILEIGADDNVYTIAAGMPSYGVSGIELERNSYRAHGDDERLPINAFYRGLEFYYRLVKILSGAD